MTMLFLSLITTAQCKNWAVLMAGSRGYNNYRHQADVFHIYDILIERGFDKSNIIMLAYDDIATHRQNPYPNQVFATADHKNVYPGPKAINYRGKDATAENFLRVLKGDTHNGPALETTEEDDIFIYYDDHGAPGLLCVPSNNGPEIYADHIIYTLNEMKKEKKFRNVFFVIEACYSGSVAQNITTKGVFVISAAGQAESSYSAQWDRKLGTFRTNEFTQHFLKYVLEKPDGRIIDAANSASEATKRSHVTAFGDPKVGKLPLSTFMLEAPARILPVENSGFENNAVENSAPTSDAFLAFLRNRLVTSQNSDERSILEKTLNAEIKRRARSSAVFDGLSLKFAPNGIPDGPAPSNIAYECYRAAIEAFRTLCGEVDEHELSRLKVFAHLCTSTPTADLVREIREQCPAPKWTADELMFN